MNDCILVLNPAPLPQNNGNITLPCLSGNYPINILDDIYE